MILGTGEKGVVTLGLSEANKFFKVTYAENGRKALVQ